jgi:hypothetical protein
MKLHFYGMGDEIFECDCPANKSLERQIVMGKTRKPLVYKVRATSGDTLYVVGNYAPGPVPEFRWSVGIAPYGTRCYEAHDKLPDWPMAWEASDYGMMLTLDVPVDVRVSRR